MRNESLQSLFGVCVGLLAKTTIGKAYAGLYSLPLLFRPFPGLLPAELPRDRYSNKRPPCPEGRGPVPQPHSPVQRGQGVLPHLPQAAPQSCCDGRLRGLVRVCACGHPQQKVLGQDSCPRSCPTCQDYAGQVLAKILLKIWQDLSLLARSWPPAKILLFLARIFPKNFLEKLPSSCRRVGANSGGVGHCSPKIVLVQVATVVAIVMVLWYQSSPIQYYWYYALPLVCCSYVWVRRSAFRAAWQGMATNRVLLLKGTVHLVGVEALVMSFFYREVLSAVLVVVSILQSVFGMHE